MMHYSIGSDTVVHRGVTLKTTVGNTQADDFIVSLNELEATNYTKVPNGLEHRPDLLANQLYGDPDKLWIVCLASNRFDVFEDFHVGAKIELL